MKPFRVLVLCTGNSARSILAEALINHLGAGKVQASSAGSRPTGRVHPLALQQIESAGLSTTGLRSKSWDEFAQAGSEVFDCVITVCDNAAYEVCPVWPGQPARLHWPLPDPAAVQGEVDLQRAAFADVFARLEQLLLDAMPKWSRSPVG